MDSVNLYVDIFHICAYTNLMHEYWLAKIGNVVKAYARTIFMIRFPIINSLLNLYRKRPHEISDLSYISQVLGWLYQPSSDELHTAKNSRRNWPNSNSPILCKHFVPLRKEKPPKSDLKPLSVIKKVPLFCYEK